MKREKASGCKKITSLILPFWSRPVGVFFGRWGEPFPWGETGALMRTAEALQKRLGANYLWGVRSASFVPVGYAVPLLLTHW